MEILKIERTLSLDEILRKISLRKLKEKIDDIEKIKIMESRIAIFKNTYGINNKIIK